MGEYAYTEDQLVEQPAIGMFAELGWSTVSALEETFGPTGTLSRETKGDVVLVARLRAALERLNPALPPRLSPPLFQGLSRFHPSVKWRFSLKLPPSPGPRSYLSGWRRFAVST